MREEILAAARQVADGNDWYVSDQLAGQTHGVYRHNMRLRYDYVVNQLESIDTEGKTLVDLGCGDGQWSVEISQRYNLKLVGVDYNSLRLERYKQNVPQAEARFGSCLEIPFADDSADIVMFHQVLEHIPKPEAALREIHRILRTGGWLILSVPNEGTWLKQKIQYKFIEPNALATSDHVNFYTPSSLRSVLETNGFSVTQLDALGFYFPHNGISRRIVGSKVLFKAATHGFAGGPGVAGLLVRLVPAYQSGTLKVVCCSRVRSCDFVDRFLAAASGRSTKSHERTDTNKKSYV